MVKEIGIAILGLGTVGGNVLQIIRENETRFEELYGIHLKVHFVYVQNLNKKRDISLEGLTVTNDIEIICNSPCVDICIECMGGSGTEENFNIIMQLIEREKNIIMSSKKCLALYKNKIIEKMKKYDVQLRYEATVGGSIPVCHIFQALSGYDPVKRIYGIANATTNYILSLMSKECMNYEKALENAKQKGYAENDITDDVEGWDALYKMSIILQFGLGIDINPKELTPYSIEEITKKCESIKEGKVKQIFYAERLEDNKIAYYVGPVVVSPNMVLSNVDGRENVIFVEQKYGGRRAYVGAGAGGRETASIMIEDLFNMLASKVQPKVAGKCNQMELLSPDDVLKRISE